MNKIKSYISPKIEKRKSKIRGIGLFAIQKIKKGEIVFIKGGYILERSEMFTSGKINSYHPISDKYVIAAKSPDEEDDIKIWVNHSCNPNCGIKGEITFVAIRNIKKGEEVTFDYAMLDNEEYEFECSCGSRNCRKIITGFDWKIKDLQKNMEITSLFIFLKR